VPPHRTSEEIDLDLAAQAEAKRQAGQRPTRDELAAERRVAKRRDEEERWRIYRTIPKGDWAKMSGRQQKVLNEQAGRYGIPLIGKEISLPEVVFWLHQFFAENKFRFADDDAPQWAEELRRENTRLKRMVRKEKQGELIPRGDLREGLALMASILRRCGDTLQRQYGPEARDVLDDALNECLEEVQAAIGVSDAAEEKKTTTPGDTSAGRDVTPTRKRRGASGKKRTRSAPARKRGG